MFLRLSTVPENRAAEYGSEPFFTNPFFSQTSLYSIVSTRTANPADLDRFGPPNIHQSPGARRVTTRTRTHRRLTGISVDHPRILAKTVLEFSMS
jgi:hypothetical protein